LKYIESSYGWSIALATVNGTAAPTYVYNNKLGQATISTCIVWYLKAINVTVQLHLFYAAAAAAARWLCLAMAVFFS
jgi:hypothetical protein